MKTLQERAAAIAGTATCHGMLDTRVYEAALAELREVAERGYAPDLELVDTGLLLKALLDRHDVGGVALRKEDAQSSEGRAALLWATIGDPYHAMGLLGGLAAKIERSARRLHTPMSLPGLPDLQIGDETDDEG